MNRKQKLLRPVKLSGEGLEIGPLCWPLVSKKEAKIKYVDHTTRAELLKIYKDDPGVPPERIPEVDYPLNGRTLRETIPKNKTFDYIIASHVIEHVPDMVRWFEDLAAVLKPGGVVTLAIPDKRYTFDIDRKPSEISDVLSAYIDKIEKPTSQMIFDYASNFRTKLDAEKVWEGELYTTSKAPHRYSLQQSFDLCVENKTQYVDTHCYVFTPSSFFALVRGLIELDLFPFKIKSFYPTEPGAYEFLVAFEKPTKTTSRHERAKTIPPVDREPTTRELNRQIETQQARIEALSAELNNVLTSKSWKATRPVRAGIRYGKDVTKKLRRHT